MKSLFAVVGALLSLMACSDIESAVWNNPRDPLGQVYDPPSVILTDTSFYRTDTVLFVLNAQSGNSTIVERTWTLDGVLLQAGDTLPSSGWSCGHHTLIVRVLDANGLSASDTAQVSILNYVPVVERVRDTMLASGEALSILLQSSDLDGTVMSYRWATNVDNVVQENNTVSLTARQNGTAEVIWSVSNVEGAIALDTFNVRWGIHDDRDGRDYKTVRIGRQVWMSQNLQYALADSSSKCYAGLEINCEIYGRLYNWNDAITACPTGSHLPSAEEWLELADYAASKGPASIWLKSKDGWGSGGGNDSLGFRALPGGAYDGADYYYQGTWGYWWTSSEADAYSGRVKGMNGALLEMQSGIDDKAVYNSVRCLVDAGELK